MKHCPTIRANNVLTHAAMCMKLKDIILSKSQSQRPQIVFI